MSPEREVLPNWTEARQESLRAFRNLEATDPTLAFARATGCGLEWVRACLG
jgi:hypothetical protein